MSSISRYDPFTRNFDDLFKGFFLRPMRLDIDTVAADMQIKVDVVESGDAYNVSAELPGAKKDDIHVTVDGNLVSISAETKKETDEKKNDRVIRSERYYGKVERSFTLGSDVDMAQSEAQFADGVLKLKLPKKTTGRAKEIAVS